MGFIQNFSKNISTMFGSYVEITQATQITLNPITLALENMNSKPKYKTNDGVEYLIFGKNDDVDLMIDRLMYKSTTHSGIVTKKAKMISGSGLSVNSELIGSKNARLNVLLKHAGGANVGLYEITTRLSYEYTKSGAVGLIVDFGSNAKDESIKDQIVKMTVASPRHMRFVKPSDDSGVYTEILYKKSFKQGADVPDGEVIPIFNPFEQQDRAILYIKNPYSVLDSYGLPNWVSAFNFIEADYEFGVQIDNAAKNGFAPRTHVTMMGRNMSKTERESAASNIQGRLSGSTGDQVVVTFVSRESEKPIIDTIEASNLDAVIDTMSHLNDAKILTAHNITSPALFGIQTTKQLGGTGTEMITSYKLFEATEIIPDRKVIIDGVSAIFDVTELENVELEVITEDVDVEFKTKPVEGGNTEDNPNVKTKTASKTTTLNKAS